LVVPSSALGAESRSAYVQLARLLRHLLLRTLLLQQKLPEHQGRLLLLHYV
jgi:hypothetical protein